MRAWSVSPRRRDESIISVLAIARSLSTARNSSRVALFWEIELSDSCLRPDSSSLRAVNCRLNSRNSSPLALCWDVELSDPCLRPDSSSLRAANCRLNSSSRPSMRSTARAFPSKEVWHFLSDDLNSAACFSPSSLYFSNSAKRILKSRSTSSIGFTAATKASLVFAAFRISASDASSEFANSSIMVCNSLGKWRQASLRLRCINPLLGSAAHAATAASNKTTAIPMAKYRLNANLTDDSRLLPHLDHRAIRRDHFQPIFGRHL